LGSSWVVILYREEATGANMALSRLNRLLVVGLLFVAVLGMAMISIGPETQYSVDELMEDPEIYNQGQIFVRGTVSDFEISECQFSLEGTVHSVLVDCSSVALPDGFSEGIIVSIRGYFSDDGFQQDPDSIGSWSLSAHEIQTGCPSKYEA
jgi:hypothetical protein|tara:strand:+ start:16588 stop:17040 length:453 start_codon:yes stop_codon:yes gene_type:complete